ncbi:MAG: glycerol kinase GlpK [Chloroflexota bacterium]|nr:glycerol kinase GlpK [Chloroflexota bacterium]MDE2919876.1 glycerol kinase GlpK [Chloroflexota bacterium]
MILAIDQGTTGTTTLVIDEDTRIVGRAYAPVDQSYPRPGWVEHDPNQIWDGVQRSARQALEVAPAGAVAAIGITNQRETAVAWDAATLQPLGPAIVWQDVRTAPQMAELEANGQGVAVREATGLRPSPYFSAGKFGWMLKHVPDVAAARDAGRLRLGTVDAWLIARLTGGAHVSDVTNASRTLLMDLDTGHWSSDMTELFGIPSHALPEIVPSEGECALTGRDAPVAPGIPISGIAGDQQAALFGHLAVSPGEAKVTYGTGCFLLQHAGNKRPQDIDHLLTTVALGRPKGLTYAYEGSVFTGGALVQWLRDELGLIGDAPEIEALARAVPDTAGAVIVPAFTGLGAPYWDPDARGAILGLTRGVTAAHLARAALEAIVHQVQDVLDLMPALSGQLLVDGGAAANDLLLHLQAASAARSVARPADIETTALGAAYLAGLAQGVWSSVDELRALRPAPTLFEPGREALTISRPNWRRAVQRTRGWASAPSDA